MEFIGDPPNLSATVGVLAGGFNPPTIAHLSLARTALAQVEQVIFVVPRRYPHKEFEGADLEQRADLIARCNASEPRFHLAITQGGLFLEITREVREWNADADPAFLCGRDAAERIANWDYGQPYAFDRMLSEFRLMVTARDGEYKPAERHAARISVLPEIGCASVSSSTVRERLRSGEAWEHLVPEAIVKEVRAIYL